MKIKRIYLLFRKIISSNLFWWFSMSLAIFLIVELLIFKQPLYVIVTSNLNYTNLTNTFNISWFGDM